MILHVFVKYGKPVEDNARILIERKLAEVYQQDEELANNEEAKFYRRMIAYEEIADYQLMEIVKTMMSYGDEDATKMRLSSGPSSRPMTEEVLVTDTNASLGVDGRRESIDLNKVFESFSNEYLNETSVQRP